jgi:hypothetical protein
MDKNEVEQILIIVKSLYKEALFIKIYREGTLCRRGVGSLPEIGISAVSATGCSSLFDNMMNKVPQQLLDNPFVYEEQKIDQPLEYIVAFYGVSKNGQTGEHAEWTKSTGIRLLLDSRTTFEHPVFEFVDTFALDAAEQTNSWYFDIMVHAAYKLTAEALPQTLFALPQTERQIQLDFENYMQQMRSSTRKWSIADLAKGKVYTDAIKRQFIANITQTEEALNLKFVPITETSTSVAVPIEEEHHVEEEKQKWWKFW